ncbi:protein SINE1-like [Nymphaea colorata]|nr:protein SINE1-like [Nymphaea colorata]
MNPTLLPSPASLLPPSLEPAGLLRPVLSGAVTPHARQRRAASADLLSASSMGRSVSPLLKQELANLEKDSNTRRSAMKALRSYVRELDSKSIPQFLAQVSESKESNSSSYEHTISLYEVLARVHGKNIVPQIRNIMSTIISTLTSSAGSFPLHQACAKVVPAIARYGIDPLCPDSEKSSIIDSLARPLSEVLMGRSECLASGAALCLKALVESDNWKFASDQTVNMVCLKLSGALEEKVTQTHSHMGLVVSLAKSSPLILEGYARSLIRSAIDICGPGETEISAQKRLNAIQLINSILKHVDPSSICSEMEQILVFLEKCRSDQLMFVRSAATDALLNARTIAVVKKLKINALSMVNESFFSQKKDRSMSPYSAESTITCNHSPRSVTPESETVTSVATSPISPAQSYCNFGRPTNRRLWMDAHSAVDVSLKDGLYSLSMTDGHTGFIGTSFEEDRKHLIDEDVTYTGAELSEQFTGFGSNSEILEAENDIPKKKYPTVPIDDIKIFTTPRKLMRSLQNQDAESNILDEESSDRSSQNSNGAELSPLNKIQEHLKLEFCEWKSSEAPNMTDWQNNVEDAAFQADKVRQSQSCHKAESVSSTDGDPVEADRALFDEMAEGKKKPRITVKKKMNPMMLVFSLCFVVLLVSIAVMFITNGTNHRDMYNNFVAT